MSVTLTPLRLESIGNELAIAWSDSSETFISLEKLRRACPCAFCGGEPDVLGRAERPVLHYGPQSFVLKEARFIGGYAWQPTWADGHNTGLYTYPLLQKLS